MPILFLIFLCMYGVTNHSTFLLLMKTQWYLMESYSIFAYLSGLSFSILHFWDLKKTFCGVIWCNLVNYLTTYNFIFFGLYFPWWETVTAVSNNKILESLNIYDKIKSCGIKRLTLRNKPAWDNWDWLHPPSG